MGVDKPRVACVGGRLLALRGTRKPGDIATALGVPRPTLHRWEHGQREPSLADLCRLADFYGVSTDALLGRKPLPKR